MHTNLKLLAAPGAALALGLFTLAGCTTDDNDPGASTGGSGGSTGTGGSGAGGAGGNAPAGVCAGSIVIDKAKPGIADFDTYDGTNLKNWSFPLGGDTSTGVTA